MIVALSVAVVLGGATGSSLGSATSPAQSPEKLDSGLGEPIAAGPASAASPNATPSAWNASGWYDLGADSALSPDLNGGTTFCSDPVLHGDLFFGGYPSYTGGANLTWLLNGSGWHELYPLHSPPALGGAAMAWDASDQEVILFGGSANGETALNTTWAFANDTWTELTGSAGPPPLEVASMFADPSDGSVVFFGGYNPSGIGSGALSNATWRFLHGRWSELAEPVAPSAREEAAVSWDSVQNEGVLFGGAAVGSDGFLLVNDTWTFANSTWARLSPSVVPSLSDGSVMADYPPLGGTVLFGGLNSKGVESNETWGFDGSTWRELSTAPAPSVPWFVPEGLAAGPDGASLTLLEPPKSSAGGDAYQGNTWEFSTLDPAVTITPSASDGTGPVAFSASSAGATYPEQFHWSFGDGANASGPSVVHVYPGVGHYTVDLTATDTSGRIAETSRVVSIYPVPSLAAGVSPELGPAPLTIAFTAGLSGGDPPYRYLWSGPGLNATNASAGALTLERPGTYEFVLDAEDATNFSILRTFNVSVDAVTSPGPLAAWAVASVSVGSAPLSVNLSAGATGGVPPYTYTWSLGAGPTVVGPAVVGVYPIPGEYNATVVVRDASGATAIATVPIVVVSAFYVVVRDLDPTPTAAVELNATPFDGAPPYSYFWNWGDGSGSTGAWANHTFATPGTYLVRLTGIDGDGHVATAETNVSIPIGTPGRTGSPPAGGSPPTPLFLLTAAAAGALVGFAGVVAVRYRRRPPAPRRPRPIAPPAARTPRPRGGFERTW